ATKKVAPKAKPAKEKLVKPKAPELNEIAAESKAPVPAADLFRADDLRNDIVDAANPQESDILEDLNDDDAMDTVDELSSSSLNEDLIEEDDFTMSEDNIMDDMEDDDREDDMDLDSYSEIDDDQDDEEGGYF
ncbi:MAG: hypothetical protein KDD50_04595, partial [Bdellovibrionales bacterium]|nr:hypothetical protein [Bdellovibrionales bacterium]